MSNDDYISSAAKTRISELEAALAAAAVLVSKPSSCLEQKEKVVIR